MVSHTTRIAPGHETAFRHFKRRQELQFVHFSRENPLRLDSGIEFGPITVAFETYGKLNAAKDNVILIQHALTGDSHCARHSPDDPQSGWWDPLIGPGRVFDTDRYYIICANTFGGCQGTTGPASIDPDTGQPYAMNFPVFTIRDMVRLQKMLLTHLGIERVFLVVGGSMGGMQALQWAVDYPDMMDGVLAVATPGQASPQSIAYNEVARQAVMNDPNWRRGNYYFHDEGPDQGLSIARMLGMITFQSDASMRMKFDRRFMNATKEEMFDFSTQFEVESYLHYQGQKLVKRFDANSFLYLTRALDLFDLSYGYESYEAAIDRVLAPVMIVGINSDILYPPYQQKEVVEIMERRGKDVRYAELDTIYGHDGFLIEFEKLSPIFRQFVEEVESTVRSRTSSFYSTS